MRRWPRDLLLLACLWCVPAMVQAAELEVKSASTRLEDKVYVLDAHIQYGLSRKALEALSNGLPLTLELQIRVLRNRQLLWDEEVASLKQRYRLQYHPLTERYLVKNLNTAVQQTYPTLDAALDALGQVESFPMLDRQLLDPDETYTVQLRVRLDIEALPAPLRPFAYLSPAWHLSSEWYSWDLPL